MRLLQVRAEILTGVGIEVLACSYRQQTMTLMF